jgi:hypothetical protein
MRKPQLLVWRLANWVLGKAMTTPLNSAAKNVKAQKKTKPKA